MFMAVELGRRFFNYGWTRGAEAGEAAGYVGLCGGSTLLHGCVFCWFLAYCRHGMACKFRAVADGRIFS